MARRVFLPYFWSVTAFITAEWEEWFYHPPPIAHTHTGIIHFACWVLNLSVCLVKLGS